MSDERETSGIAPWLAGASAPTRWLARLARLALDPADWSRVAEPALADVVRERSSRAELARVGVACLLAFGERRVRRWGDASWIGLGALAAASAAGAASLTATAPRLASLHLAFVAGGVAIAAMVGTSSASALRRAMTALAWLAAASLAATSVLGVAEGGVRRWLAVGPLTLQVSHLVWPLVVAPLALGARGRVSWWRAVAAVVSTAALVVQGDTTMVAICAAAIAAARVARGEIRAAALAATAGTVAAAAAARVPVALAEVPHVEGAWAQLATAPAALGALAVLGLGGLVAAPAAVALRAGPSSTAVRPLGAALAVALAGIVARSLVVDGEPVAFLGYGGSMIVGAALAMGLLAAVQRDERDGGAAPALVHRAR